MTDVGQTTRNTRQPAGAYLVPGVRTPLAKAGSVFAKAAVLDLSAPVARAMADKGRPDLLLWGQVIPDPTLSNIARELVFEAGLAPRSPPSPTSWPVPPA